MDGKFTIEAFNGKQAGTGKIDGGILILSFSNNQLKLTKTGDVLEGPFVFGTTTGSIRVTRVRQ